MALKDLQHYLDNPDDLPTDPADLAELGKLLDGTKLPEAGTESEQAETKESAPAGAAETKQTDQTEVKDVQGGKDATAKTEATPGDEEAPIATRDGKRTIPYDVLRTERERRQVAEGAVAQLQQQVDEIRAQLAKGTQAGTQQAAETAQQAAETLSPEELEALKEDFPAFGKVIDGLMKTIDGLQHRVETLAQGESTRQAHEQRQTAMTVQDHIDANPVLAHLQAKNPDLFSRAVELDNTLMKDSAFQDMGERFAKVADTMELLYGPFDGVTKKAAPAQKTAEAPAVSKEEARKAVEQKVKQTPASPKSLSDLPSGEAPDSNEYEALENASPLEISDRLMKMTPDQRIAFLNRL